MIDNDVCHRRCLGLHVVPVACVKGRLPIPHGNAISYGDAPGERSGNAQVLPELPASMKFLV